MKIFELWGWDIIVYFFLALASICGAILAVKMSKNLFIYGVIVGAIFFITVPTVNYIKDKEVPRIKLLIENEHRNYPDGSDVFGIEWKKGYSSHTVRVTNESKRKSIKQLSLILGFEASVLYRSVVSQNGVQGARQGKDIVGELQVVGPISENEELRTKVMSMKVANVFNPNIEKLLPGGSVRFRVILNSDKPQAVFVTMGYHYDRHGKVEKVVGSGNMAREERDARFPMKKR